MNVTLHRARPEDASAILSWMVPFNAFEGISFDPVASRPALLQLLGDASLGGIWLIHANQAPVGYAMVTFGFDLEYGGRDALLTELFLEPVTRGHGVGRSALLLVKAEVAALGIKALHLQVRPENAAALHLYETVGFKRVGRLVLSAKL